MKAVILADGLGMRLGEESERISKPTGAYLVIAVPNEHGPLGELNVNPLNAPPHHESLWPRSALEYIAKAYGLTLEVYAKEPISRTLYFTLIEESFQAAMPGQGLIAKIARKLLRWKINADAALKFATEDRFRYGHNHIAIYRRPG